MEREDRTTTARAALSRLRSLADPERAAASARFFKTGPGEYGEGDRFLGLTVPRVRALARECALPLDELEALLASEWHEARLLALLLYVREFQRRPAKNEPPSVARARRKALFDSYLSHKQHVDNWDLVDTSAPVIVGGFLLERDRGLLARLARSRSVWDRRIAVLATFAFIRRGEADDTLRLAEALLGDEHDLVHKAVGWMLREVGQRCGARTLTDFLDAHAGAMPRTMLRYAIERLPATRRAHYLAAPRANGRRPGGKEAPRAATQAQRRGQRTISSEPEKRGTSIRATASSTQLRAPSSSSPE